MNAVKVEIEGVVHIEGHPDDSYTLCGNAIDEHPEADIGTRKSVNCERCLEILKHFKSLRVT